MEKKIMKQKYHRNKKGMMSLCHATVRGCPLGQPDSEHIMASSDEEANEIFQERMSQEYGYGLPKQEKSVNWNGLTAADREEMHRLMAEMGDPVSSFMPTKNGGYTLSCNNGNWSTEFDRNGNVVMSFYADDDNKNFYDLQIHNARNVFRYLKQKDKYEKPYSKDAILNSTRVCMPRSHFDSYKDIVTQTDRAFASSGFSKFIQMQNHENEMKVMELLNKGHSPANVEKILKSQGMDHWDLSGTEKNVGEFGRYGLGWAKYRMEKDGDDPEKIKEKLEEYKEYRDDIYVGEKYVERENKLYEGLNAQQRYQINNQKSKLEEDADLDDPHFAQRIFGNLEGLKRKLLQEQETNNQQKTSSQQQSKPYTPMTPEQVQSGKEMIANMSINNNPPSSQQNSTTKEARDPSKQKVKTQIPRNWVGNYNEAIKSLEDYNEVLLARNYFMRRDEHINNNSEHISVLRKNNPWMKDGDVEDYIQYLKALNEGIEDIFRKKNIDITKHSLVKGEIIYQG
jgi:hypothetical protein